jgi:phage portal protein BeeE
VIHSHTRNPLDDYYGMPPARPAAGRIDTANAMRSFTAGVLHNSRRPGRAADARPSDHSGRAPGDPGPLPQRVRRRRGWHSLRAGRTEATYTAMGLPLGERGLVLPELDEILDAKIAMVSACRWS